jgi:hypothetical protein
VKINPAFKLYARKSEAKTRKSLTKKGTKEKKDFLQFDYRSLVEN